MIPSPQSEPACLAALQVRLEEFVKRYDDNRTSDQRLSDVEKELRAKALELAQTVNEAHTKISDARLAYLEKFVWIAVGAVMGLELLLRWLK